MVQLSIILETNHNPVNTTQEIDCVFQRLSVFLDFEIIVIDSSTISKACLRSVEEQHPDSIKIINAPVLSDGEDWFEIGLEYAAADCFLRVEDSFIQSSTNIENYLYDPNKITDHEVNNIYKTVNYAFLSLSTEIKGRKYVGIMGGLGNQMFQYAFSKYLEHKFNCQPLLHLDFFEYFKSDSIITSRDFNLDKMYTDYIPIHGDLVCDRIIDESSFSDQDYNDIDIYYKGYWQDKKYFEYVKEYVYRDFTLLSKYITPDLNETIRLMKKTCSVSLHIRRTDYLNSQNINVFSELNIDYYSKALDLLKARLNSNLTVFCFSDDTDYAHGLMQALGETDFIVIDPHMPYQDIYLMSQTCHSIIANSSFSWWGAALVQQDENHITIAPKEWYKNKPSPNLYLDGWDKL